METVISANIGNTNVTLAVETDGVRHIERRQSSAFDSVSDFSLFIGELFAKHDIPAKAVNGAVISSVKPVLTSCLADAVEYISGISPVLVNPSIKMRLDLSRYDISLIGGDRIAAAEGAVQKYGQPSVVFDFGTATTVNVIDNDGCFLGGSILVGIRMGINALAKDTAMLPKLEELTGECVLIGQNTKECIISGAIFGNAAMFEGITARLRRLLGNKTPIIITGGNAPFIKQASNLIFDSETGIIHDTELLIDGLFFLERLNR